MKMGQKPDDISGDIIERLLTNSGHTITGRRLVSDSKPAIRRATREALKSKHVDVVIITGGTGLSPRDVTIESVEPLLEKQIPGFGEFFRRTSFDRIGTPAMLTRASAGSCRGKLVFCLPGSPDAVETGVQLILPELPHMIKITREH